jgi:hypothetical protein
VTRTQLHEFVRTSKRAEDARPGRGCGTAVCLALLVLVLFLSQFAAR